MRRCLELQLRDKRLLCMHLRAPSCTLLITFHLAHDALNIAPTSQCPFPPPFKVLILPSPSRHQTNDGPAPLGPHPSSTIFISTSPAAHSLIQTLPPIPVHPPPIPAHAVALTHTNWSAWWASVLHPHGAQDTFSSSSHHRSVIPTHLNNPPPSSPLLIPKGLPVHLLVHTSVHANAHTHLGRLGGPQCHARVAPRTPPHPHPPPCPSWYQSEAACQPPKACARGKGAGCGTQACLQGSMCVSVCACVIQGLAYTICYTPRFPALMFRDRRIAISRYMALY
eukprot:1160974-Pelagomonas_calceolata.AAC.4